VVTLEDLSREPSRARGLSPDTIATLLVQCGAAQGALLAALVSSNRCTQSPNQKNRLLTIGDDAAKLAIKPEWGEHTVAREVLADSGPRNGYDAIVAALRTAM